MWNKHLLTGLLVLSASAVLQPELSSPASATPLTQVRIAPIVGGAGLNIEQADYYYRRKSGYHGGSHYRMGNRNYYGHNRYWKGKHYAHNNNWRWRNNHWHGYPNYGYGFGYGYGYGVPWWILAAPYGFGYDAYDYDGYDDDYGDGHVRNCLNRYRSYDPRSDTYMGYDGRRHRCRLP